MPISNLGTVGNFILYHDSTQEKKYLLVSKDFDYRIPFESEYKARCYAHKLYNSYQKGHVNFLGR